MKILSLQIAAAVVLLALGAPLTFFPVTWARFVGWHLPEDLRLVRYFGRCLGAVALVLVGFTAYASLHPQLVGAALVITAAAMWLVLAVHLVGALEKSQPLFETLEIGIYLPAGIYFTWLALS
jgi:hypothetical protein